MKTKETGFINSHLSSNFSFCIFSPERAYMYEALTVKNSPVPTLNFDCKASPAYVKPKTKRRAQCKIKNTKGKGKGK